jgi:diaminopimelate epimerase
MSGLAFEKYEGLGNDFIVVEVEREGIVSKALAAQLCDRRLGVGADGVLLVLPAEDPSHRARMVVINADGSIPEMCGNGLRCVALHLAGGGVFETGAGLRTCELDTTSALAMVSVDMGEVLSQGDRVLDVEGESVRVAVADAGNPHAVIFGATTRADIERLGPRIATHREFPSGTNVEFATLNDGRIDLVVWERGVGLTLACGTGACATAVVACEKGLIPWDSPVTVRLPGGDLSIEVAQKTRRVKMRGPARHVFSGRFDT